MTPAINTFFGQVAVINLKSRLDRRAEMSEQLRRIGLGFDSPNVQLFEAAKPPDAAGFSSMGAHGCFISHLTLLRAARARGASSILILEDDLNFADNFNAKFGVTARFLEAKGWGMWYGSYFLDQPPALCDAPCIQVEPQRSIGTSAFLAINGPHIDALVVYLEAMLGRPPGDRQGGPMHIDGAYCWFRRSHPEVLTWLATPALGFQRSSRTDVHTLRWFDRLNWFAGWIATARRWRNRLRAW